jgi:hypothetical protein
MEIEVSDETKKLQGKKNSADVVTSELWKSTKLPKLPQKFSINQTLYDDENFNLFHSTPERSQS